MDAIDTHGLVTRLMKLSDDERLTEDEQNLMFASSVQLTSYRKTIEEMSDRINRLYNEIVKENHANE